MAAKYPSIKAIKDGLDISYSAAKALKAAMQDGKAAVWVMAKAAELMNVAPAPFGNYYRMYESTGLYHIDADVLSYEGHNCKRLIHDRCDGSWYVMGEHEYRQMEITAAGYNA